jgi:Holliday junction resolvase RusA-like endonuclease
VTIEFTIPGTPCAKAKKLGTINGHAHGYNDPKTDSYQKIVRDSARQAIRDAGLTEPLDKALTLCAIAVYPRLACQCKRAKRTGLLLGDVSEGRIPKPSKPDGDNLWKSIGDGITASGLWTDDARVFDGRVVKWFAAIGEFPHVEVRIESLGPVATAEPVGAATVCPARGPLIAECSRRLDPGVPLEGWRSPLAAPVRTGKRRAKKGAAYKAKTGTKTV